MLINLISIFHRKTNTEDLSFLNISYLRFDPTSQTLILYNNASKPVKDVRLVVLNTMKQSFMKDFERLGERSGNAVPFDQLSDGMGSTFNGIIHKAIIHFNNSKVSFEYKNNSFIRL